MTRPARVVVIAGTGTEIGKTWVACRVAEQLRGAGRRVAARKPVQSFEPGDTTDADLLALATGEARHDVCPAGRWYEVAMAPFMAADALGRPRILLDDLAAELIWPDGIEIGLVEPAGGVRSPMTHDGADTVDLAHRLAADQVVLVGDAGLGTLNAIRLCLDALHGLDVLVFLNRYDDHSALHAANRRWLLHHSPAPLLTSIEELARALGG